MTIVSTLFYSVNMVVAELLFDHISIVAFVILKHILPYLANIAVPLLVIATQEDIRREAMVGRLQRTSRQLFFSQAVFARPAVGGDLEEMTLLQLKRELLAGAGGLGESVEEED